MNLKVKFRESFRPFARIFRRERVADYFEMEAESPYLLLVAPVKPESKPLPTNLIGIDLLKAERSTLPAIPMWITRPVSRPFPRNNQLLMIY